MILHQSDLSALSRCMQEYGLKRAGAPGKTNSAAAYGSVMHHAITAGERAIATGTARASAIAQAQETFVYYWHPLNIETVCDPVPDDGWLPQQSYVSLRNRGLETITKYFELIKYDDSELLATEMSFSVPIDGTWDEELGEPHVLVGSIDRLAVGFYRRNETLKIDDYKTGREYKYLRQNLQGTAYAYATTKREFWTGWRGEDGFGAERGAQLFERFQHKARRFTWINLKTVKHMDGGWRGPLDYERFALAVEQFAALIRAEVFPLTLVGEVCTFCQMRGICGGMGVPDNEHGAPETLR